MAPGLKRFSVGTRVFVDRCKDYVIPATVEKTWTSEVGTYVKLVRKDHESRWMHGQMSKLDMIVCEQDHYHYMFQCRKLYADVVIEDGIATIYPRDDGLSYVLDRNVAFTRDVAFYIGALGLTERDDQIRIVR